VPYCQKYTPTDCFFSDFSHWTSSNQKLELAVECT